MAAVEQHQFQDHTRSFVDSSEMCGGGKGKRGRKDLDNLLWDSRAWRFPEYIKGVALTVWWVKMLEEHWANLMSFMEEYFWKRPVFPQIFHLLDQVIRENGRISWHS